MKNFIGLPLEDVINQLESQNKKYRVILNNFNVNGDTTLVTNAKIRNQEVVLTVGKFIFNL